MGNQTNNLAESMGALDAIKLTHELGAKKVWLEGDSNNIINYLLGYQHQSWMIKNIIYTAKELLDGLDQYYISYVYRESNKSVDWVANEAVQSGQIMIWYGERELPQVARDILNYERYHRKQGRI